MNCLGMFFRNVQIFSSFYCMRIFGLYLLMFYFAFSCSNAVFSIFRTNVNFNNAHTKLYILFSPIIDAAHKMHLSSTYFLVLAYTHIIKEVCVCWNRFHIHTFCDAMTLSTQNATGKIFYSFLVTRHACSLPLYLITNLFCEPCCYNFLNATKIVIESSRWNKRFCNSNIYIHYSKYITVTKMVRIKNKIGQI